MLILFKGIEITSVFLSNLIEFSANSDFLAGNQHLSPIFRYYFGNIPYHPGKANRRRIAVRRSFPAIAPHPWMGYNKVGLRKKRSRYKGSNEFFWPKTRFTILFKR
jgi:hypothetical protein